MAIYRIIECTTDSTIIEKRFRNDKLAKDWLTKLLERGVIFGVPVQLERRLMSDEKADAQPLLASGQKRSPWEAV